MTNIIKLDTRKKAKTLWKPNPNTPIGWRIFSPSSVVEFRDNNFTPTSKPEFKRDQFDDRLFDLFGDRVDRIRSSLNKINDLMVGLRSQHKNEQGPNRKKPNLKLMK